MTSKLLKIYLGLLVGLLGLFSWAVFQLHTTSATVNKPIHVRLKYKGEIVAEGTLKPSPDKTNNYTGVLVLSGPR